jgi:TonB family protein
MPGLYRSLALALMYIPVLVLGQSTVSQPATASAAQAPSAPVVNAQSATKVEMPSDPAALLELAAKVNGLQNAGTEPLHIKATYQLLDDKGGVQETGTIEELRVSDKNYKLAYSSPSFHQTDYSTDAGLFRVGDPEWPDAPVWEAHNILYPEFPSREVIKNNKVEFTDKKVGNVEMKCVNVNSSKSDVPNYKQTYCFNPAEPMLRILETYQGVDQVVYNSIVPIRGTYIGRDAVFFQRGKALVRVHLDVLNAIPDVDKSDLTPPSAAHQITRRIDIGLVRTLAKPIHEAKPEYPAIARAARVQGTVVLEAVIGKDGRVVEARAISGPPMLQQAGIDTVKQSVYQPQLLDGEAVEVATRVNVVFSLGNIPPNSIP